MNKSTYWKNFKLGKELDISGRFIYNGLECFHNMKSFHYEEDAFEFLYNISVGIERLLKICIILIEHNDNLDQEKFEKSLRTHNHQDLLTRIQKKHKLKLSKPHSDFMQILVKFYKSYRYGRYGLGFVGDGEKIELHHFLEKHLKLEIDDETLFVTLNENMIKNFIGKIIGKITQQLYEIISLEARRLNIYTYEIRYATKAYKIFIARQYNFFNEDILWKELLIFFVNSKNNSGEMKFIKSIKPLDFGSLLLANYMQCFGSNLKKLAFIMDELEHHYMGLENVKDRLNTIEVIGNPAITWDDDEDI